jgi:hypothetical protein
VLLLGKKWKFIRWVWRNSVVGKWVVFIFHCFYYFYFKLLFYWCYFFFIIGNINK